MTNQPSERDSLRPAHPDFVRDIGAAGNSACGPDFFIVGAPKCGTTALDGYLGEHPQIFMGRKEQHFFGSDLDELWTHPGHGQRPTANEYFGMFAATSWARRRGESSVWYLRSRRAAHEIHSYRPNAQIIVMLRNPLDVLPSLHSQFVYDEIEELESFEAALAAEADRRAGFRIPPHNSDHPWRLFYRDVVRFRDQLERYFTVFGRDRVHVILYDDFASDTLGEYQRVLQFLDVDLTFVPAIRVINANKRIRSRALRQIIWDIYDPASHVRRIGTRLIPIHRVRSALLREVPPALARVNRVVVPRAAVGQGVRADLASELAGEIEELASLIGRDLSHWAAPNDAQGSDILRGGPVVRSPEVE